MLAGFLLRKSGKLTEKGFKGLNIFVLYVAFPPLILHHIPACLAHSGITTKLLLPASMGWILLIVAFIVFCLLGRIFKWSKATVGALILSAGIANTSLEGFPIIEALFGPDALDTAIIVSQAGSFIALSTLGLVIAAYFSKHDTSPAEIAKRLFSFPPFLATIFSVLIYLLNIEIPELVDAVLVKLAASLIPVALVSIGGQISFDTVLLKARQHPLVVGLVFKLLLAPVLFWLLYVDILHDYTSATEITVIESAMAPALTGTIIAAQFDLDSKLAYLLVGMGIPLSLISVFGWYQIAKPVFG